LITRGAKGKEGLLIKARQRKDNHGWKKVKSWENVTDVVVKPSSSEKFKHCLNSIDRISC
jgi:hypothetical protein